MRLAELTWTEAKAKNAKIVLLPIGSLEQHGYHLPLNNDAFVAQGLSDLLAVKLYEHSFTALVAPTLPFGLSEHHMGFYGSLSLSADTFQSVIKEVCSGLASHGLSHIIIVNGHGGNSEAIGRVVKELAGVAHVVVVEYWRHLSLDATREIESGFFCHACEGETSVSLALGQHARMECAVSEYPEGDISNYNLLDKREKAMVKLPSIDTISRSGVIGNAALADRDKGQNILAHVLPALVREVLSSVSGSLTP